MAFAASLTLQLQRPHPTLQSITHRHTRTMRHRASPKTPPEACVPANAESVHKRNSLNSAPTYCWRCATLLEERTPPGDERVRNVCPNCHLVAYENPKLVVGCVPVSKDRKRVLLAKRAIPPVGKWTVPAGFLELGETTEGGAAREAWEEARAKLDMQPATLLAVYSILPAKQVQLLYQSTLLNEESVAPGLESQEVRMFEWDRIPWDDLAFPTVKWALEYSYEHRNGELKKPQMKCR